MPDEPVKLTRYTHIPISKRKKQADGSLLIWGDITDDTLDSDGEIVDPDFAAQALTDWFQGGGPVFNQHCEFYPPAGQGVSLELNPGAPAAIRAHIVEPTAVAHVESGVYKDFSVGWYDPEYVVDRNAPNGRMVGGWAREVSVVDAGANKNAKIKGFVVAKSKSKGQPPELFGVLGAPSALSRADAADLVDLPEDGVDNFSRSLKAAQTRRAEKALAASRWYAAFKRDMDPNVGGGVDRDKLEPGDFVLPDEGDGKFPVVTPADVEDAFQSWGRYTGPTSFEEFKSKLIALAKRKGSAFVAMLPDSWDVKKGKATKMDDETTTATATAPAPKAKKAPPVPIKTEDVPDGNKICPTCKGTKTIMEGNRKCPDCGQKGFVPNEFTKAKAVKEDQSAVDAAAKQDDLDDDDDDPNDEVDASIEDLMDDVEDAAAAQADDVAGDTADGSPETPEDVAVDQAIDATGNAVADLANAQATDDASLKTAKPAAKATKAKAKAPAPEAPPTVAAPDDDPVAPPEGKGKGKGKAKQAPPAATDGGDGGTPPPGEGAGEAEMLDKSKKAMHPKDCMCKKCKQLRKINPAMGMGKSKKTKALKPIPPEMLAAHDALCPVYDVPAGAALKALSSPIFLTNYHRAQETGSDVTRAYDALAASMKVRLMEVPDFGRLRSAAHKALEAAYPDLSGTGYMLRSPDQFHRPFLAGANDETPTGGFGIPSPDMAPVFGPANFDRMSQIPNESRPSLTGGSSAASLVGKGLRRNKKKDKDRSAAGGPEMGGGVIPEIKGKKDKLPKGAREFYTNASKDEHAELAGGLHDLISKMFPGICPMVGHTDLGAGDGGDSAEKATEKHDPDGISGLPPSQGMPKPQALPEPSGADTGTLKPAATGGADKGKAEKESVKDRKAKRQARKLKALKRANRRLKSKQVSFIKEVRDELHKPDPRARKNRGPGNNFIPLNRDADQEERTERVRAASHRLKERAHSRNSPTSAEAVEQLRSTLTPKEFAAVMTADDDQP